MTLNGLMIFRQRETIHSVLQQKNILSASDPDDVILPGRTGKSLKNCKKTLNNQN